jgi:hypothetical protein
MPQLASAAGLGGLPPHKSELMASMSFVLATEGRQDLFLFYRPCATDSSPLPQRAAHVKILHVNSLAFRHHIPP